MSLFLNRNITALAGSDTLATADNTIATIPNSTVADASTAASVAGSVNASLAVVRNNIADLKAKIDALVSAFNS